LILTYSSDNFSFSVFSQTAAKLLNFIEENQLIKFLQNPLNSFCFVEIYRIIGINFEILCGISKYN